MSSPHRWFRLTRPAWALSAFGVIIAIIVSVLFMLPVYRRRVAVADIVRLGGKVQFSDWRPSWAREGWWSPRNESLFLVNVVSFQEISVGDNAVLPLKNLSQLEAVYLGGTRVTDDGLISLKSAHRLRSLNLSHTRISDAGLAHLRHLMALRDLHLSGTRITDAGLMHLYHLQHLKILVIADTKVTESGIAKLKRMLPDLEIQTFIQR